MPKRDLPSPGKVKKYYYLKERCVKKTPQLMH